MDKLGWSVLNQCKEELLAWICVGSFINWEKPFKDVIEHKFDLL